MEGRWRRRRRGRRRGGERKREEEKENEEEEEEDDDEEEEGEEEGEEKEDDNDVTKLVLMPTQPRRLYQAKEEEEVVVEGGGGGGGGGCVCAGGWVWVRARVWCVCACVWCSVSVLHPDKNIWIRKSSPWLLLVLHALTRFTGLPTHWYNGAKVSCIVLVYVFQCAHAQYTIDVLSTSALGMGCTSLLGNYVKRQRRRLRWWYLWPKMACPRNTIWLWFLAIVKALCRARNLQATCTPTQTHACTLPKLKSFR